MDNQNVVNSSAELTLGDIENGAKEAMKRVMSYPSWERLSSETQRALFYYQAYCDGEAGGVGKAGARLTLDITGLTSQAEREDIYKRAWLDGWRYALERVAEIGAGELAEIVAELADNPAPITLPDWV